MKKLLILPLLLLTLTTFADRVYVATTGNDGTGDGSISNPYLTIATGITNASSGDTVYVVAGTYNVTAQMAVGTGISIVGEGATSIIASSSAINAIFLLESASEGTNGNQSISHLRLTGGDAVNYGVQIVARSNVLIHDCEFDGFEYFAIQNRGGTSGGTGRPVTWATGNRIYNNTVTDCGYDTLDGSTWLVYGGGVEITGQDGVLVYDNDIDNAVGFGWGIRCLNDSGFLKGAKIYNNDINVGFIDVAGQTSYAFCIEIWTGKGGIEVYDNTCNGGIDFSGYGFDDTGGYGFALKVYGNKCIFPVKPTNTEESGLIFESGSAGGVYFQRNYIKNFSKGIVLSMRQNSLVQGIDGLYVDYNIFTEIGSVSASMTGTTAEFNCVPSTGWTYPTVNDFRFANNTLHRGGTPVQTYGINMYANASGAGATWTNVVVANNITYNVYTPCKWEDQTVNGATLVDNISYNATNNNRFVDCTTSDLSVEAFSTANPLFKSNETFRLRPTSPAIDAGTDMGLTTDYWGHRVPQNGTPDIGACEYGNYVLFYNGKQLY
jgi:hypothetical protein